MAARTKNRYNETPLILNTGKKLIIKIDAAKLETKIMRFGPGRLNLNLNYNFRHFLNVSGRILSYLNFSDSVSFESF